MNTVTEASPRGVGVPPPSPPDTSGVPTRRAALLGARVLCVVLALGVWQLLVVTGALPDAAIAAPWDIGRALGSMFADGALWPAIRDTATTWAIGLGLSLAAAVPVGLLLGASGLLYRVSRFSIDFLRSIPPIALIPLVLLQYGATTRMALVLVVFGSLWPVLLQSMYGMHQLDPNLRDMARTYGIGRWHYVRFVVLPSASPFVATGIRVAATMSLLLAIAAQLIGGAPGLGAEMTTYEQGGDVPRMWAVVVVIGLLGILLNRGLLALERRTLRWHSAYRPAAAS
ncbi:ABC transporter permease [Streptomyces sp. GMY02]|uniref:ABC transporter permease n=1 Tax=Streptomyces sp. GMY02 TaxID=1333528 RepID=UPI001C2C2A74|nr:ABC transporter permease [Streptomyces sp. GMY02]QXE33758.1 ABC transporter permease [Streptomyces sp. GMY02]